MNIARFRFNPIVENTYVLWDETGQAAIVDAGNSSAGEDKVLSDFIAEKDLTPVLAVNTHGHFDHASGVPYLVRTYGVPFAAHSGDAFLLENAATQGSLFGITVGEIPSIDIDLAGRDEIAFGNTVLRIIPTPGHTPGHVALFEPESGVVFTGDTLFEGTIGRTDLPGGDYSWIMKSILENLLPLGDDVRVYPGHGGDTTIGKEAAGNPFIVEVLNREVGY
ncbi:MAG: MBL fold metallo-hydrolase [Rikenellaceae bacterium]|nr:MBL fold metallo-hydrolase [Rikenellaceae bacterium]